MGAAWLILRADLRRRWRAVLAMARLIGLVSGVVLVAAAGTRRTDTAYPRFLRRSHAADLLVSPVRSGFHGYFQAVAGLPQVASPPQACTVTADQRPGEIRHYTSVRNTPTVLGALLAAGTLSHVLLTSVTIPVPLVLLAIPLTLALAAALAVWPGRAAVRARPAAALRAE